VNKCVINKKDFIKTISQWQKYIFFGLYAKKYIFQPVQLFAFFAS
jgi:hypothetical protein